MIDFVSAIHREDIYAANLGKFERDVVEQRGYDNVAKAYNEAGTALDWIVCYLHEDVYLPDSFMPDLIKAIEAAPKDWGVLGVAGTRLSPGKEIHGYILDRGKPWGRPFDEPIEVDTLDELLLITRGDIRFDEQFPLDFYGADICMQAKEQGLKNYVIPAFVEHNSTRQMGQRTKSFFESQAKFRAKWINRLPIVTTCATIV